MGGGIDGRPDMGNIPMSALTTASTDFLPDENGNSGFIGGVAGRIASLNFPNIGIGDPFSGGDEETATGSTDDSDDGDSNFGFGGLPDIDIPDVGIPDIDIPFWGRGNGSIIPNITWSRANHTNGSLGEDGFPDRGSLNTQLSQVIQQVFNITMSIDWPNLDNYSVIRILRIIGQILYDLMTSVDWQNGDLSNINLNSSTLQMSNAMRLFELILTTDWNTETTTNWQEAIAFINEGLPEGSPFLELSLNGGNLPFLNWTGVNLTSIQSFLRATDMQNIEELLSLLPLPDAVLDTLAMVMDFDWQRVNMTGLGDMPVPSSTADLIRLAFTFMQQNNMTFTGMSQWQFMNMSVSSLDTVFSLLNVDLRNLNWTAVNNLPIPASLKPYLYILMHTNWENMDMNTMAALMPTSFQEIWYMAMNMDWENVDWMDLALSLIPMPDSVREFLYAANNFDWNEFDMRQMNMTAALPYEWREYLMMIMNMDWRNITMNNVTDFILPVQIRDFLMMLNETDWSRYNSTANILLNLPIPEEVKNALLMLMETNWTRFNSTFDAISNLPVPDQVKGALLVLLYTDWEMVDWSTMDLSNFPLPEYIRNRVMSMMMMDDGQMEEFNFTALEWIYSLMSVDWENFDWTNENITSLPVPPAVSRFLIMAMRTDWENMDWSSIDLSALDIPDSVKAFLFTMANADWTNATWTGMIDTLPIPPGNREFIQMIIATDWFDMGWANFTMNMTVSDLDWQKLFCILNLPMSEDFRNILMMMLTEDSSMMTPTSSTYNFQAIAFLLNVDWGTLDYMQMVDLSGLPLPADIKQLLMMAMDVDWENFNWMGMNMTDMIDMSGLQMSDNMRELMYILTSMDWSNFNWVEAIDLSGLPIPDTLKQIIEMVLTMDWTNPQWSEMDLSDMPMSNELRDILQILMGIDWENFDWTQVIDLPVLPMSNQTKEFLHMLMSMDWENVDWNEMDLSMIPMPNQMREMIEVMMLLDWQNIDLAQVIDLSGLPLSDETKLFLYQIMNMDWENPNWNEVDFSQLPLSEDLRNILYISMTMDFEGFDWSQMIDLSGLPISDQMKVLLHWMMNMDWNNMDWMNMDMSDMPQPISDLLIVLQGIDWENFGWSSVIDLSGLPIPEPFRPDNIMRHISTFMRAIDSLISNIVHKVMYEVYTSLARFLYWTDLPFLPELPYPWPLPIVGDNVTYACRRGFELVGSAVLTCTPDGSWSGMVPECISEYCC